MVWSSLFWANLGLGLNSQQKLTPEHKLQVPGGTLHTSGRPNIVFILTDDQDLHLNSLDYMPFVQKHLIQRGTLYKQHYATVALCCPSRVSLWTGKTAHNTNVTDVFPPYGGYPKFVSQGLNDNFLPIWLQDAGYNTYYTGKLFNAHTVDNYHSPFVNGFTGSDFLLDPYTYQYLNSTYQRNKDAPVRHEGEHTTELLARKTYDFLNDAVKEERPFFLTVAPVAPHSNVKFRSTEGIIDDNVAEFSPPIPLGRHEHLFNDAKVPRTENFNPKEPSGVNWVRGLARQSKENVDFNDHFYRNRLRALQGIDEIVDGVVSRLRKHGILDNTYIVYSSDNGYHIGQHRLQPGKECGFEEDINIPLMIRGPNVPENVTTDIVTTHTDLAPTFLQLIGAPLRADFDGEVIPTSESGIAKASVKRHEHVNVEYWGFAAGEGKDWDGVRIHHNNTYKALRVIGDSYNLYYSVWCNKEHELYDLNNDPGQLRNLLSNKRSPSQTLLGFPLHKVAARLDGLLFVLKSCKGRTCIEPWRALHPDGNVEKLRDALSARFDEFYEVQQKKIEYSRCEDGYIIDAEGPQFENDGLVYRYNSHWSDWV
ncbi:arylsulfatase-like protein [Cucurbitaria berberidis CBS 394.84]|uniref:Arylsulfatase n=1 Tax=Cucurbitaria berberidis CBS 394.84 TaxID=1168544 RepID=A0A9P4LBM2_9PLEO|nr:arylsulfatase-like protein [Cucurbitaria berberidis CBS 394.84]KAF1849200.1 arylsulfatase-like protein [Cucurbitaria berberidis CBS 394.84]